MTDTKTIYDTIKLLSADQHISMNQLCKRSNLLAQNISKKGLANTLYYTDVVKLLSSLHYHIEIKPDRPITTDEK